MKLSLVIATVERTQEFETLLTSLAAQAFRNFEVIVVDQNSDDRLLPILDAFRPQFPLVHLRTPILNCCHARNLGMEAATGEILGFPDDDCSYQPDTMIRIMRRFEQSPGLTLLSGNCVSPDGRLINGRWIPYSCDITPANVWTTLQGFTLWVRSAALRKAGGFDEAIGPGTEWGSGEEPDLALRLLATGARGFYDAEIGILHPDKTLTPVALRRASLYGAGMGRVFRKHGTPLRTVLPFLLRPAGGALLNLLRLQPSAARYYWQTLTGRLHGYFAPLGPARLRRSPPEA